MNSDDHSRTIVHIDLDCFYAQVETLKNPQLRDVPVGIQQKNIVVTSNYKAREYGIKKCMLLTEAVEKCPTLVLVNGEDLNDYRTMSYKVTNLLQKYSENVERLGLDENFIDVSKLVEERKRNGTMVEVIGNVFGNTEDLCQCGCDVRIKLGSIIADEIRRKIRDELGLTSCAGIAHNKLVAKIVCSKHKPNQQTLIYPNSSVELMLNLSSIENIPGIGRATSELLRSCGIRTVQDMQNVEINVLTQIFDADKARFLQFLSYGIDNTPVKRSGKPRSIGLEDSCKLISAEKEVKEKLTELLTRLLLLVNNDGRIPKTIKLTVRKFDKLTKTSRRETKQSNINPHLFTDQHINTDRILVVVMNLFRKLVQVRKPFHITLLGLSFTKFNERPDVRNTIASFIRKHLEVQSITSIENVNGAEESSPESTAPSPSSCRESSDVECEPTPKRSKLQVFKKNFMEYDTCESPCKLRVQDLHLTPEKRDNNQNIRCPPNADEGVFKELPVEVQQELWSEYKRNRNNDGGGGSFRASKKAKGNNLLNYFVKK